MGARNRGEEGLADVADAELMLALRAGREAALAEAYRRHAAPMLRLAERLLGDAGLAEDVVQETFVRLWQHPEAFDPSRGSLRSYALAITYGRSIDRLRSDDSRRRRERADNDGAADGPEDGVHDAAWRSVVVDEVRAALQVLSEGEAEAIILAFFGGFSYQQVAVLLGQPEGTTKARIRSGLRRMREVLVPSLAEGPMVIDLRERATRGAASPLAT